MLPNCAHRDLGQPLVLIIESVASDPNFGRDDVLVEGETLAQTQGDADVFSIELLTGVTEFEAIEETDGCSIRDELIIRQLDPADVQRRANAAIGLIARDQRPRREPAAALPLERGDAARQAQLATGLDALGRGWPAARQGGSGSARRVRR